jgi:4-methylaminobutanoate oxidase (formaldehyde-forming)
LIEVAAAPVRATRISYVGELGYELLLPAAHAIGVFDALRTAGEPFGLRLAGYHAMNSLRIEKAYRHWGHDVTPDNTPLEAGLDFCVAWDKPGGFIGREALLKKRDRLLSSFLVQFLLQDPAPLLYHDEPIWRNGVRVGRITSGMYGYTLAGAVGLGYVQLPQAAPRCAFAEGTYEIEIAGRRIPARASIRPFYDPKSEAARA